MVNKGAHTIDRREYYLHKGIFERQRDQFETRFNPEELTLRSFGLYTLSFSPNPVVVSRNQAGPLALSHCPRAHLFLLSTTP